MKNTVPGADLPNPIVQVIDIQEEKKLEGEAAALVELHDFIKAHPDSPVKDIARFMPPVDARAVSKAIKLLAIRDRSVTPADKEALRQKAAAVEASHGPVRWGKR